MINYISYYIGLPLISISVSLSFTPIHDAIHNAIARKDSGYFWVNNFLGHLCSLQFLIPYSVFKYFHLQHHKYLNIKNKDPDLFTS